MPMQEKARLEDLVAMLGITPNFTGPRATPTLVAVRKSVRPSVREPDLTVASRSAVGYFPKARRERTKGEVSRARGALATLLVRLGTVVCGLQATELRSFVSWLQRLLSGTLTEASAALRLVLRRREMPRRGPKL